MDVVDYLKNITQVHNSNSANSLRLVNFGERKPWDKIPIKPKSVKGSKV